jgi:hypothetical protein
MNAPTPLVRMPFELKHVTYSSIASLNNVLVAGKTDKKQNTI